MTAVLASADPALLLVLLCVGAVTTLAAGVAAVVFAAWLACRATVGAARLTLRACRSRRHLPHPTRQETTP